MENPELQRDFNDALCCGIEKSIKPFIEQNETKYLFDKEEYLFSLLICNNYDLALFAYEKRKQENNNINIKELTLKFNAEENDKVNLMKLLFKQRNAIDKFKFLIELIGLENIKKCDYENWIIESDNVSMYEYLLKNNLLTEVTTGHDGFIFCINSNAPRIAKYMTENDQEFKELIKTEAYRDGIIAEVSFIATYGGLRFLMFKLLDSFGLNIYDCLIKNLLNINFRFDSDREAMIASLLEFNIKDEDIPKIREKCSMEAFMHIELKKAVKEHPELAKFM
jgi:hypothetical protein